MSRKPSEELLTFLEPFDRRLVERALAARKTVLRRAGGCWELMYQTYAVSTAFAFTEDLKHAFCHVAVYRKHVNLGFNRGVELPDPTSVLQGTGKLIRHVRLDDEVDLARGPAVDLIDAAIENMRLRMAERGEEPTKGVAIVKSTAGKKR